MEPKALAQNLHKAWKRSFTQAQQLCCNTYGLDIPKPAEVGGISDLKTKLLPEKGIRNEHQRSGTMALQAIFTIKDSDISSPELRFSQLGGFRQSKSCNPGMNH